MKLVPLLVRIHFVCGRMATVASFKSKFNFKLHVLFTLLILSSYEANAAKPAPDELVERFVEASKQVSQEYFGANVKNYQSLIDCLSDESHCAKTDVLSEHNGKPLRLTFDQDELLDFLTVRLKEYRVLVGLSLYSALRAGLAVGRGRAVLSPLQKGLSSPLVYSTRDQEGMDEFKRIERFYEQQKEDVNAFNNWLTDARFDDGVVEYTSIVHFANKNIAQFLKSYPFLAKMMKADFSKRAFIKALSEIRDDFQSTKRHIASLEGDKRKEVFGFVSIMEDVLKAFKKSEQDAILEHFQHLAESSNFWSKLKETINLKWVVTIGCFAASVPVPVLLTVCYAMGLTLAVPAILDITTQTKRLLTYLKTSQFDEDVMQTIMVSNMISTVMLGIYFKSAVPSFTVSVSTFKETKRSFISSVKLKGLNLMKFNKNLLHETGDRIFGSVKFNAKEMGMEQGMNDLMTAVNLAVPIRVTVFSNKINKFFLYLMS